MLSITRHASTFIALLTTLGPLACSAANGEATDSNRDDSVGLALGGGTLPMRGTTLSSAEFGADRLPGTFGTDYTYPTNAEVDYFVGKGMTSFRIPFLWERLQRAPKTALDPDELARLDAIVRYATSRGATVILDPHDYARYAGQVVGAGIGDDAFADFWSRVAAHYRADARVVFALMNEPHDLPTEQWAGAAQAAIDAIRAAGATNLILVPGNEWTGAHSWTETWYGTANAVVMLGIRDPGNNYAFEVHQYLDSNFSGTHPDCTNGTIGSESMRAFTDWLRVNGKRGFLGEFGGGDNPTCIAAIDDQLRFLEANADLYLGWSWWAAGPWWGDYFLSIEPKNGQDRPMLSVLEAHLRFSTPPPNGGGGGGGGGGGNGGGSGGGGSGGSGGPSNGGGSGPPAGGAGITASLTITSDWQSGYCADVHLHNGGAAAVTGWSVTIDAGSSTLSQAWNVRVDRSGTSYTAHPVDWNAPVAAGAEADWGFCANKGADGAKATIVSAR